MLRYKQILGSEFGQITVGNTMKWQYTEPAQGQFSYADADTVVSLARSHGRVSGGTRWCGTTSFPGGSQRAGRSAPGCDAQPHHQRGDATSRARSSTGTWSTRRSRTTGRAAQSAFQTKIGDGYIAEAFKTARAADPGAKLCNNDYNIEGLSAKSDAIYNLVKASRPRASRSTASGCRPT